MGRRHDDGNVRRCAVSHRSDSWGRGEEMAVAAGEVDGWEWGVEVAGRVAGGAGAVEVVEVVGVGHWRHCVFVGFWPFRRLGYVLVLLWS